MKRYSAEQIRNIALAGHQGSGKTSLAEAMLFDSGAIDRLGRVDDGTAKTDFDPDEVKRSISINLALAPVEWKGVKINVIDAPGYLDFIGEVRDALAVSGQVFLLGDRGLQVVDRAGERVAESLDVSARQHLAVGGRHLVLIGGRTLEVVDTTPFVASMPAAPRGAGKY